MKKLFERRKWILSYFFAGCAVLLLTFSLFLSNFNTVNAQGNLPPGVTPQEIKGVLSKMTQTDSNSGELLSSFEAYIDFWNVGELGGDAYKTAKVYLTIYYKNEGTTTATYDLNFSGGPDGIFTLVSGPQVTSGSPGFLTQRAIDDVNQVWVPKRMFYEQVECQSTCNLRSGMVDSPWFYFENCNAFSGWFTQCSTCSAELSWDPNLKPGDILSPVINYKDPNGQPIQIVSQALFIKGQETWSTQWDGNETALELQYTCPDHIGHVLSMTIPAAGIIQQPNQPSNQFIPPANPPQAPPQAPPQTPPQAPPPGTSLTDLIKTILIGFGLVAVLTTSVVVAGKAIKSSKSTKPIVQVKEAKPAVKKPKLSEEERSFLMTRRSLLEAKWSEIRKEIISREIKHQNLVRLNSSNRSKALLLKAIDVKGAISGPVGKIVGEGFKKATGVDIDKMLFDLDNARDVDILVKGKQAQATLKGYIAQLRQDLKSTAREINKIDAQLAEPG